MSDIQRGRKLGIIIPIRGEEITSEGKSISEKLEKQ